MQYVVPVETRSDPDNVQAAEGQGSSRAVWSSTDSKKWWMAVNAVEPRNVMERRLGSKARYEADIF